MVNWLGAIAGTVAAVAGIGAWVVAVRAMRESRRAAEAADDSTAEVLAATGRVENALARAEARALERDDVDWEVEFVEGRGWVLTNDGRDPAFDVSAYLRVDDDGESIEVDEVHGGGDVVFPRLARPVDEEPETEELDLGMGRTFSVPAISHIGMHSHWVRVSWRTRHGVWKVKEEGGPWVP